MGMMHFELSSFLRQTPNVLLSEYFRARGLLDHLDVAALRPHQVQPVLDALGALDEPARASIEDELRDVHLVARRAGVAAMQDELALRGQPVAAASLSALANDHARALRVLLDHGPASGGAFDALRGFAMARSHDLPRLRRRSGLPPERPQVDAEARHRLAEAVRAHFRPQGRGQHCEVRVYERFNPHRYCFFVYAQDHTAAPLTIDGEGLGTTVFSPAFEVAFIWRWEEGVLEVGAPVSRPGDVDALVARFREAVLPGGGGDANARSLRLHPVLDPHFRFPTDARDGILQVDVAGVRFVEQRARGGKLELVRSPDEELLTFLQRVVNLEDLYDRGFDLSMVKMRVVWRGRGRCKPTTTTFHLVMPDGTDLSDEPKHQVIRRYLARWQLAA